MIGSDGTRCVACQNIIRDKPAVMRLQITHEEPKLIQRAKELGFSSASWRTGDSMEGKFDQKCFNLAAIVWQIAFHTRALSPRH